MVVHGVATFPAMVACAFAPPRENTASSSNRIEPPPRAHSKPAASSWFPARALAVRRAKESIAPLCGTPAARDPFRPQSWTVRYGGARVMVIISRARIVPCRQLAAAPVGRASDRTLPSRRDQGCASPRGCRADILRFALPRLRRFRPSPAASALTDAEVGALDPAR